MAMRQSYLQMISAFPGGWDAMAGALGVSRASLHNRIYEIKRQSVPVDLAMTMQALSSSTHFAEAVARESGGAFLVLPEIDDIDNEAIQAKFNEAYRDIGKLFETFIKVSDDGVIDTHERVELQGAADEIHKRIAQLLALMFRVYCRDGASAQGGGAA